MKLYYNELNLEINFQENIFNVLVIENKELYSDFFRNLFVECNGGDGSVFISDHGNDINISKNVEFIVNPYDLDFNNRKIINALYSELDNIAVEEMMEQTSELNVKEINYIDELINKVPYDLTYDIKPDVTGLLKLYGVKVNDDSDSLLERIENYIRVVHQIINTSFVVFSNIKLFMSKEEIDELYKFCEYEKVYLLLLEGTKSEKQYNETITIVDQDKCIITLD